MSTTSLDDASSAEVAAALPAVRRLATPASAGAILMSDWSIAALGAVAIVVIVVGSAIVVTVAAVLAAGGSTADVGTGGALGIGLAFPAFGSATTVTVGHAAHFSGLRISSFVWPWMLVPVGAIAVVLRFASARTREDPRQPFAFALKVGMLTAILLGVLAAVAPHRGAAPGDGFSLDVNPWAPVIGALLLVGGGGLAVAAYERSRVWLRLRGRDRLSRVIAPLAGGVTAALLAVLLGAVVAIPAAMAGARDSGERVELAAALPVLGGNLATHAAALSTGASVDVHRAPDPIDTPRLDLTHLAFPPDGLDHSTPWDYLLLLLPLAAVVLATARTVRRSRPQLGWSALADGLAVGVVFALALGLFAALSVIDVAAAAPHLDRSGDLLVVANAGSTIGHALLFGLAGGGVTALAAAAWARLPWAVANRRSDPS